MELYKWGGGGLSLFLAVFLHFLSYKEYTLIGCFKIHNEMLMLTHRLDDCRLHRGI